MNWRDKMRMKKVDFIFISFFGGFVDQGLVNVGYDTTTSNGPFDEGVELFISSNSELQVPGRNPLHLQILARIPSQLQNLRSQILQNRSQVHCSCCPNTPTRLCPLLQLPVDSTHRKLRPTHKQKRIKDHNFTI